MNLNLPSLAMFFTGVVLIYSAVKNKDPRDVVKEALGQTATRGPISGFGERGGEITEQTPIQPMPPNIGVPVVSV